MKGEDSNAPYQESVGGFFGQHLVFVKLETSYQIELRSHSNKCQSDKIFVYDHIFMKHETEVKFEFFL